MTTARNSRQSLFLGCSWCQRARFIESDELKKKLLNGEKTGGKAASPELYWRLRGKGSEAKVSLGKVNYKTNALLKAVYITLEDFLGKLEQIKNEKGAKKFGQFINKLFAPLTQDEKDAIHYTFRIIDINHDGVSSVSFYLIEFYRLCSKNGCYSSVKYTWRRTIELVRVSRSSRSSI